MSIGVKHRRRSCQFAGIALWLLCGLVGCRVGPDHFSPPAPVGGVWYQPEGDGLRWHSADLSHWWLDFGDPQLVQLIDVAAQQNLTAQEAFERIGEARSFRGVVRGDLFPQFGLKALYDRRQVSGNGNPFVVRQTSPFDFLSAGFDAAWEMDVWGKYRRAVEAADADLDATVEDYHATLVSLFAEVAASYVQLRTFQNRIAIARRNARLQDETVRFVESRVKAGLKQELALAQARANLHETRAAIPDLRSGLRVSANRLSVLRGEPPHDLLAELGAWGPIPHSRAELALGLPAELLLRRPDLRQAEREVAAQNARIGVATADLFPQVTLTGLITVDANELAKLFTGQSITANYGPSIRWNFLNFGRLRNNVRVQDSRHRQAIIAFQQTALLALEEVENGLAGYAFEQQRARELEAAVTAADRAVKLAGSRYRQGLIEFLDVLQTQRTLLSLQDDLAVSLGNIALQRIAIYKALGGGWHGASLVPSGPQVIPLPAEELPLPDENGE